MLLQFKQQLSENGVLAINLLVTDAASLSHVLMAIRKLFNRKTLCLSIPDHKNIVVFAFNQRPPYRSQNELHSRISQLVEIFGLDSGLLLEQLVKDNPVDSGVF